LASRILSKSISDGVKRWIEPNNVLGASVDGSSTLKQVILGFQLCIEDIGFKKK
jgi:hypothetical protein